MHFFLWFLYIYFQAQDRGLLPPSGHNTSMLLHKILPWPARVTRSTHCQQSLLSQQKSVHLFERFHSTRRLQHVHSSTWVEDQHCWSDHRWFYDDLLHSKTYHVSGQLSELERHVKKCLILLSKLIVDFLFVLCSL